MRAYVFFKDEDKDEIYLMMSLADMGGIANIDEKNGDLECESTVCYKHLQKRLTEEKNKNFGSECLSEREKIAKFIFGQIAEGIGYMHEQKVANRDLKPENMLFTTNAEGTTNYWPDRAVITDFTTAMEVPESENGEPYKIFSQNGT